MAYRIIKASKVLAPTAATTALQIILCYDPLNTATPWVTWLSNPDRPGERSWGHYYESQLQALQDYHHRCFTYGIQP